MNVRLVSTGDKPEGPHPGTIPMLYQIDAKGTLTIAMLKESLVKDAIRAGKIAGDAGKQSMDDAVITADGPALDRFLTSRSGLMLFDKPFLVAHRVD